MTDTFNWRVNMESPGEATYRMYASEFGDGYSQDVSAGINTKRQSWNVSFTGKKTEVLAIIAFLDTQSGKTFFWKAPLTTAVAKYQCLKYTPTDHGGGYWTLNMEFKQKFSP